MTSVFKMLSMALIYYRLMFPCFVSLSTCCMCFCHCVQVASPSPQTQSAGSCRGTSTLWFPPATSGCWRCTWASTVRGWTLLRWLPGDTRCPSMTYTLWLRFLSGLSVATLRSVALRLRARVIYGVLCHLTRTCIP